MNWLHVLVLRCMLWDCNYAIRRVKEAMTAHRAELLDRENRKVQIETELFNATHQMIED